MVLSFSLKSSFDEKCLRQAKDLIINHIKSWGICGSVEVLASSVRCAYILCRFACSLLSTNYFMQRNLKNISRNVTGEKGLGAQISRPWCTHFRKNILSLLGFQSNMVCISFSALTVESDPALTFLKQLILSQAVHRTE